MHAFNVGNYCPLQMAYLGYALSYMSQRVEPHLLASGASAEQEGQRHSVLDCAGVSLSLLKRYTEEQKQSCLSLCGADLLRSGDKDVFS